MVLIVFAARDKTHDMAIYQIIRGSRILIGGGDMRNELWARGMSPEGELDLAAAERPQAVRDAFDVFRSRGAEALLTQTFALNSVFLEWAGAPLAADRLDQLNQQAAAVATSAVAENDRDSCLILGVIGPPGALLTLDEVSPDNLRAAYERQAAALRTGGVSAIALLGFTELEALLVALEAVAPTAEAPVIAGMTFGCGGDFDETPMGAKLAAAISGIDAAAPTAFLIDPGDFPDAAPDLVKAAAILTDIPIGVCLPAGAPVFADGQLSHSDTPVDFATRLAPLAAAGARFILAGPGAGPDHLAALLAARERLKITGRR